MLGFPMAEGSDLSRLHKAEDSMLDAEDGDSKQDSLMEAVERDADSAARKGVKKVKDAQPPHRLYEIGQRRTRVLLVGNLNGRLNLVNNLAKQSNAHVVVHSGILGFVDESTYNEMDFDLLKARVQALTHLSANERARLCNLAGPDLRSVLREKMMLSDLPLYVSTDGAPAKRRLAVPFYTVWSAYEDVAVVEKVKNGTYSIDNMHILDHSATHKIGDVRLMGLGGDVVYSKLLDQGTGEELAGDSGHMWITLSQVADLLATVDKECESTDVRLFVSYASPGREPFIAQLAHSLQADYTASGQIRTQTCVTYNHWAVHDPVQWSQSQAQSAGAIDQYWAVYKEALRSECSEDEFAALQKAVDVGRDRVALDEIRSVWNIGICDAGYGTAVINVINGKISLTTSADGRDFVNRRRHAEKSLRIEKMKRLVEEQQKKEEEAAHEERPDVSPVDHTTESIGASENGPTDHETADNALKQNDEEEQQEVAADKSAKKDKPQKQEIPKVFVKHLPETYTQDDVAKLFADCVIRRISPLPRPGGFCVEFENSESVDNAMKLHDTEVGDRQILVELPQAALTRRGRGSDSRSSKGGRVVCRYWARDKSCRLGDTCTFLHPAK